MNENALLVPRAHTVLQQATMRAVHDVTEMLEREGLSKHATIVIVLQGGQIVAHITNTTVKTINLAVG